MKFCRYSVMSLMLMVFVGSAYSEATGCELTDMLLAGHADRMLIYDCTATANNKDTLRMNGKMPGSENVFYDFRKLDYKEGREFKRIVCDFRPGIITQGDGYDFNYAFEADTWSSVLPCHFHVSLSIIDQSGKNHNLDYELATPYHTYSVFQSIPEFIHSMHMEVEEVEDSHGPLHGVQEHE